ncbi:MAG TPA: hypothetical protein PKX79_13135 [Spirochaetota bacterium]|nr:hypothetical protein [Spirochaetota bacterium]HOK93791.1 hypothetical protein [Spirochaetota bacterium]HPP96307.1 hypothetical protein [Spirochaetota bacterium]
MIDYIVVSFALIQGLIFFMEFFFPLKSFELWKRWVFSKFFPSHGIVLIFIGIVLSLYKGYMSRIIFYIGLIIALTGPLLLIYPEKIRSAFSDAEITFSSGGLKGVIRFDAVIRLLLCVILIISFIRSFYN